MPNEGQEDKYMFGKFMEKVDAAMLDIAEVTSGDIEDYNYRNAYDDAERPYDVALDALKNAGWRFVNA